MTRRAGEIRVPAGSSWAKRYLFEALLGDEISEAEAEKIARDLYPREQSSATSGSTSRTPGGARPG